MWLAVDHNSQEPALDTGYRHKWVVSLSHACEVAGLYFELTSLFLILPISMEKNSAVFVPYSYLYYDGVMLDNQPVRVVSSCRLNIYTFPFDSQNCSFSFNSYLHRCK